MPLPTAISRRLQQCAGHLQQQDWEGALVNLFPALDSTAKRRHPKEGVGSRIKLFLEEEEALISAVATGNIYSGIHVDGLSITDALYKFGRTSIIHEGQLDPKLSFTSDGSLRIGRDKWELPSGYVIGMAIAVVVAPENAHERVSDQLMFTLFGDKLVVNNLWGQRDEVRRLLAVRFGNPDLFTDRQFSRPSTEVRSEVFGQHRDRPADR